MRGNGGMPYVQIPIHQYLVRATPTYKNLCLLFSTCYSYEIIKIVGAEGTPRVVDVYHCGCDMLTYRCTGCTAHYPFSIKIECPLPEKTLVRYIKWVSPYLPVSPMEVTLIHEHPWPHSSNHGGKRINGWIGHFNGHPKVPIFVNAIIYFGPHWKTHVQNFSGFSESCFGTELRGEDAVLLGKGLCENGPNKVLLDCSVIKY